MRSTSMKSLSLSRRLFALRFFITTTTVLMPGVASAQVRFEVLHAFGGTPDGGFPVAPLVQGTDGDLYGTTEFGGTTSEGTIFKLTSGGTLTVLHSFTGTPDGSLPRSGLIQAIDGNFYGMASEGGSAAFGTVFKMP